MRLRLLASSWRVDSCDPHDVHVPLHSATSVFIWLVCHCRFAVSRFFEDAQVVFTSLFLDSDRPSLRWPDLTLGVQTSIHQDEPDNSYQMARSFSLQLSNRPKQRHWYIWTQCHNTFQPVTLSNPSSQADFLT